MNVYFWNYINKNSPSLSFFRYNISEEFHWHKKSFSPAARKALDDFWVQLPRHRTSQLDIFYIERALDHQIQCVVQTEELSDTAAGF